MSICGCQNGTGMGGEMGEGKSEELKKARSGSHLNTEQKREPTVVLFIFAPPFSSEACRVTALSLASLSLSLSSHPSIHPDPPTLFPTPKALPPTHWACPAMSKNEQSQQTTRLPPLLSPARAVPISQTVLASRCDPDVLGGVRCCLYTEKKNKNTIICPIENTKYGYGLPLPPSFVPCHSPRNMASSPL